MAIEISSDNWNDEEITVSTYEEINEFLTENRSKAYTAEEILMNLEPDGLDNANSLQEMVEELIDKNEYEAKNELAFISHYIRTQETIVCLEYLVGREQVEKRVLNNRTYYRSLRK